jgi:hypothetical protein
MYFICSMLTDLARRGAQLEGFGWIWCKSIYRSNVNRVEFADGHEANLEIWPATVAPSVKCAILPIKTNLSEIFPILSNSSYYILRLCLVALSLKESFIS